MHDYVRIDPMIDVVGIVHRRVYKFVSIYTTLLSRGHSSTSPTLEPVSGAILILGIGGQNLKVIRFQGPQMRGGPLGFLTRVI